MAIAKNENGRYSPRRKISTRAITHAYTYRR